MNDASCKVLIVEDDPGISKFLRTTLNTNHYEVLWTDTGVKALEMISSHCPDCILLDLGLPDLDGTEVIRRVRSWTKTPIIVISARSMEEDKAYALDLGADDYLPKPFAANEFLARVRALTRRSNTYASFALSFGNVTLDCCQYLRKTAFEEVRLNNKEFQLTELFLRHPRQVFSSEHLMEKVWGLDSEAEMDVVWTYIGFLRKKLRQIGADIEIRTIRGAGYALEEMPC